MDKLIKDMQSKGLVNFERQPLFEKYPAINNAQLTYWKFLDSKIALVTKMKLQHILPTCLNPYAKN